MRSYGSMSVLNEMTARDGGGWLFALYFLQQNGSVCAQFPYKGKEKKHPTQLYQVATASPFPLEDESI